MIRRAKRGVEEAKLKGTWPHILEANIQHLQSQIAKSAKWIKTKSTKKAHKSGDVRMKGSIGVHWIASLKCIIYVCLLCCNVLFDLMPLFLCVPSLFLLSVLVLSCCPRFFSHCPCQEFALCFFLLVLLFCARLQSRQIHRNSSSIWSSHFLLYTNSDTQCNGS